MSEMKRKLIQHRLSKEIKDMIQKYPRAVVDEAFKIYPNFDVLRYQINSMIDCDMDPKPIFDHIEIYKLELFDTIMELARTKITEPES